jgi:hypothetical protein
VVQRPRIELPPLGNLSPDALRAIWAPTLRDFGRERRTAFMMRLRDLVPLIVAFDDETGAAGLATLSSPSSGGGLDEGRLPAYL